MLIHSTRRTLLKQIPAIGLAAVLPPLHAAPLMAPPSRLKIDVMNDLKLIVTLMLKQVPEVGTLLSTLCALLWPSNEVDPWDQIRQQVEAMIDQKINDAVFSLLRSKLDGLGGAVKLYVQAVAAKDTNVMREQFIATNTVFVAAASEFQNPDYEWTLAPVFAIFAQLHVGLLRDCVLHGKTWGWNEAAFEDVVTQARETVKAYVAHLDAATDHQKEKLARRAPASPGQHQTDLHNYWQPFWQTQILLIDDFRALLVHLDPVKYPAPTQTLPFKDVYSLAYGTADDWDGTCQSWSQSGVATPYSAPLEGFTSVYIEIFNQTPRVVDVRYPSAKGPLVQNGQRIDQCGIIANALRGREIRTIDFPEATKSRQFSVEKALVRGESIPFALTLVLADGSPKWLWDRRDNGISKTHEVAVPGRMLSTLTMWSRSRFYDDDLGCIIFGFSRDARHVPDNVMESMYIGAFVEPNPGSRNAPPTISPDLQERRNAYWRDIQSRQHPGNPQGLG